MLFDLPHHVLAQAEAIRAAFVLFQEPQSREAFVNQLQMYLRGDPRFIEVRPDPEQYFSPGLVALRKDEYFVDVGAFDGDTLKSYLAHGGRRYLGLEPDPGNFDKLQRYVAGLPVDVRSGIEILPTAASDAHAQLHFDATGTDESSINSAGQAEVEAAPLDEMPLGGIPTYIKMDVEGHEYQTLSGARRIIQAHHPILAVALYHQPEDLWRLSLLIAEMYSGYSLLLRPYLHCGFELDLYALPPERLVVPA
jgi:FkbM family methyltransferase